jgi:hypothetical protein
VTRRSLPLLQAVLAPPLPDGPLSDFEAGNGPRLPVREPQRVFDLTYRDPDGDDLSFDLTFLR